MSSVNAVRSRLSLLLVGLMLLPSAVTILSYQIEDGDLLDGSRMDAIDFVLETHSILGIPESGDPSHGWKGDSGNVGEASLFYRTATYVPIGEWETTTGEDYMSGWFALAHEYPLPSDWRDELSELGMECRTFYSPQGFHCKVPKMTPAELSDYGVIGAFRLDSADKLAPDVISLVEGGTSNAVMQGERFVMNVVLGGSDELANLISTGIEVVDYRVDRVAEVVVDQEDVVGLVNLDFVEWVEPKYPVQLDNEAAAGIIDVDWAGEASNMDSFGGTLSGAGVIVGVMDSGLDTVVECSGLSHCNAVNSGVHADFVGRIAGVVSYTCGSCTDGPEDQHGHGTHVAGSVLGDGTNSPDGADNSGMAPGAHLFMQSVLCGGSLCNPSYDVFFSEAYDEGARVHTNSWGSGPSPSNNCPQAGSNTGSCLAYYSTGALEIDTEANSLTDLTILFAMGNDGMDCTYNSYGQPSCYGGKDGEINLGAMNQQATAKNILSVGSSENYRDSLSLYARTYSGLCNDVPGGCDEPTTNERFSMSPIRSDTLSDDPEGMSAYSNRGPTNDGRIKPDIVAPGGWILSTRSDLASANPSQDDPSGFYTHKFGTSMATPITAGSVALVIEYLNNIGAYNCDLVNNPLSAQCPESALIKAILASGAHDLEGQYTTGGDSNGNGAEEKAPNNHEGWGRIDLQQLVHSGFTEGIEIFTSDSHSFKLTVPDTGVENFRVVLSWNDPANSPSAGQQLINDLDILLKSPSGTVHTYTNDDLNNLVGISLGGNPEVGDWEIVVTGSNIPSGPQKYYLASSVGVIEDMRHPVSDGLSTGVPLNEPGFQSGSIFTETTMSAGGDHLCAILDDSSLQCWGDNSFGQLGDGSTSDRLTMTEVGLDAARTAVSISSGKDHTCSILDNGGLQCWGRNNHGQLGDGTAVHSNSPVDVSLSGVPVQLSSGDWHSCAILDDASLQCWGMNDRGQLGDGTNADSSTPVSVSIGENVLAVSTGSSHTCVITDSWALKCWGDNSNGQLGIGSTSSSNSPTTVTVGGNAVAVSAGGSHTCALLDGNNVKCWGDNSNGQLGDGGTNQQNDAATVGVSLAGVIAIDSGDVHTCAVDSSDSLHCWGGSANGQVGDGSTSDQITSPIEIALGQNLGALSVSSGSSYTCVVGSNDLARCWGGHGSGALSLGTSPSEFTTPMWSYISSSERDWNDNGNLNIFEVGVSNDDDGDGFPNSIDSDPSNPTVAADCSSGSYGRFTCREATSGYYVSGTGNTVMTPASPGHYVDSNGATSEVPCERGEFQRLSGQTSCDDAEPGYYVPDPGASEGTPCPAGKYNDLPGQEEVTACKWAEEGHSVPVLIQITSGASHSCAILDDGSVGCWGENSNGQLGDGSRSPALEAEKSSMPLGRKAVEISAGSYHTCAMFDDGSVRCWGLNEFGQLGDGTTVERTTPVQVDLGEGKSALGISTGESHSCAVLNDHSVKCWGQNINGQLGDGTTTDSSVPVHAAMDGEDALLVSAGSYHTCAIMGDRSVMCWGDNWHGQLGDGTNADRSSPVEVEVPGNSSAVSLDAGTMHTCLGVNDGSMFCWGYNAFGQLGNGGNSNSNTPMTAPLSLDQVLTTVQVGLFHSCALFDSGQVACWGGNSNGQLGDGTQSGSGIPEIVSLGTNATSISVGQRHSCAILDDASLKCWGANEAGQLGDGTDSDRNNPATIDLGHGSKEQLPCAPGTYQPNPEQTSCILADRGFMVPQSGATTQMGCISGYYSSLKGQSACTPASKGYYVEDAESASQTPCPSGKSTLEEASTFFDMCFDDFDGDGIPDLYDDDADNDGVLNTDDYDWLDPEVSADSDGDRIPDSIDEDDDNDGVNDTVDPFPMDQGEWEDKDGDGIGDNADQDDDGDGKRDIFDVFPNDENEWSDADGDGIGDNSDADDDNDGRCDDTTYWNQDQIPPSNSGPDQDGDNIPDCYASAKGDAFPFDANETDDTDGDSIGNNVDTDCDGDGWLNPVPCTMNSDGTNDTDAFPLEDWRWSDSDGDGHADQGKNADVFPDDSTEWMDSDSDGVGNNADECEFEPGIGPDTVDFISLLSIPGNKLGCPIQAIIGDEIIVDESEFDAVGFDDADAPDFDNDDIPDLLDPDDDNDGIPDIEDGILGDSKWSKDPFRPFTNENWAIIVISISFIGIIGYRAFGWKRRGISNIRSKKIRIQ